MPEITLPELVADLVALRHTGGYRFKVQERVLRQFAEHCRREGYSDGSITKEALDGFLYGRHLRSSTIRRNELALRQLTEHAQTVGWDAYTPQPRERAFGRLTSRRMCSPMRRCAACFKRSTLSECPATRIRRSSTRSCSGCSTTRGCESPRRSSWPSRTWTRAPGRCGSATRKTVRAGPSRSPIGLPRPWTRTSRPRTRPPGTATTSSTAGAGQADQPGDRLHAVSWLPG